MNFYHINYTFIIDCVSDHYHYNQYRCCASCVYRDDILNKKEKKKEKRKVIVHVSIK